MSDMIKDGVAWLGNQLNTYASVSTTYTRGAVSVSVTATIGSSLLKLDQNYDQRIQHTDADFDYQTADLTAAFVAAGSMFTEPKRGDRITASFADGSRYYDVLPVGNEPHWRWLDPINHTRLRVHGTYKGNA